MKIAGRMNSVHVETLNVVLPHTFVKDFALGVNVLHLKDIFKQNRHDGRKIRQGQRKIGDSKLSGFQFSFSLAII